MALNPKAQAYIQEYNRKHYKAFKVDLRIDELEELNGILKKEGLSKADFLRKAILDLKFQHEVNQAFENKKKKEFEELSHNSH